MGFKTFKTACMSFKTACVGFETACMGFKTACMGFKTARVWLLNRTLRPDHKYTVVRSRTIFEPAVYITWVFGASDNSHQLA